MSVSSTVEALVNCAFTRSWTVGMCGQFCAAMYGYGASGYADAVTQWRNIPAALKHPAGTSPPPGALVFWSGGSHGFGHVAVADGIGSVWSIDIGGAGTVTLVPTGTINDRWGLPYLGWSAPYFQGELWEPVSIYGVDVSQYQPINFALTTPSDNHPVDFVIIKATEGMTVTNPRLAGQRQWARDHDLSVGFYHFARPGSMVDQADRFLSVASPLPGEHLWFDWEDAGVSNAQKDAWISYVQGKAAPHRTGLYCNTSFWKTRDTTSFAGDGLWIADPNNPPGTPGIQSAWMIQQYSEAGDYDHNIAQFSSRDAMAAWAGGTPDMTLTASELKLLTDTNTAVTKITSLVDTKVHGVGFYLAHAEQDIAAVLAQAKANGQILSVIKTVLDTVDLSQLPAQIAAKLESLKLIVSVAEEV